MHRIHRSTFTKGSNYFWVNQKGKDHQLSIDCSPSTTNWSEARMPMTFAEMVWPSAYAYNPKATNVEDGGTGTCHSPQWTLG